MILAVSNSDTLISDHLQVGDNLSRKHLTSAETTRKMATFCEPAVLNDDGLPTFAINYDQLRGQVITPYDYTADENSRRNQSKSSKSKLHKSPSFSNAAMKHESDSQDLSTMLKIDELSNRTMASRSAVSQTAPNTVFRPRWLNDQYITPVQGPESFVKAPQTSYNFSRHAQIPQLYFDTTFSRMFTKLVDQKLVLVSHPYDVPYGQKTFERSNSFVRSPFDLHTEFSSPRNLTLPSISNKMQVESRFNKPSQSVSSDSRSFAPMTRQRTSQGFETPTLLSPRFDDQKLVKPRSSKLMKYPQTLRQKSSDFPKNRPIRVSTELMHYYSQLIDTKSRDRLPRKISRESTTTDDSKEESPPKRKPDRVIRFQEPVKDSEKERKQFIFNQLNLKSSQNVASKVEQLANRDSRAFTN